jgi:hypothetical protein
MLQFIAFDSRVESSEPDSSAPFHIGHCAAARPGNATPKAIAASSIIRPKRILEERMAVFLQDDVGSGLQILNSLRANRGGEPTEVSAGSRRLLAPIPAAYRL